ncbi:CBS domain-containing protein [Thiosocius teredinicola]|uniref:CBS domain-containing protein n=1 Tax=Thiosocius teredinicola TaxID=1973002 RepID=UPI000990FD34
MLPTMTARDCMSRKVNSLRPDDDVLAAVRVLVENRISGAPVIDNIGNLLGILTEKDCMAIALSAGYHGESGGKVRDYMSTEVMTVDADTPVIEIAEHFATKHFRRLPVLESGRVVGVVSRRDVLWLLEQRSKPDPGRA